MSLIYWTPDTKICKRIWLSSDNGWKKWPGLEVMHNNGKSKALNPVSTFYKICKQKQFTVSESVFHW